MKIIETTYNKLLQSTRAEHGNDREKISRRVSINAIKYIPSIPDGTLTVKFETTTIDDSYNSSIMFEVDYVNEENIGDIKDQSQIFRFKDVSGGNLEVYKPPLNSTNIKVSCSCLDFYYRWASYNAKDGSLLGDPPPPYIKKTDRPSVNPGNSPGLCKHLIYVVEFLKSEGLFI